MHGRSRDGGRGWTARSLHTELAGLNGLRALTGLHREKREQIWPQYETMGLTKTSPGEKLRVHEAEFGDCLDKESEGRGKTHKPIPGF